MTVTQTAARLGISTRRVRELIAAGVIKARKLGPIWLVESVGEWNRKRGRPRKERDDG